MNVEKVNSILKSIGKRTKIKEFKGYAEYSNDTEFYELTNGKMIIVFWELGVIKSILEQNIKNKRYTYSINGQEGKNTKQIYEAEFNWNTNKYLDICN